MAVVEKHPRCKCGNIDWLRIRTRGLGPDFTDCRNCFGHIPAKCSECGSRRKVDRNAVKDGMMSWQDWRKQEGLPLHDDW